MLQLDDFSDTVCFLKYPVSALSQQSPTFMARGTSFMEDSFSKDRVGAGGMVLGVLGAMGIGR